MEKTEEPSPNTVNSEWERPTGVFHAHFDCFSGAAGDMILAACLDASDASAALLSHIRYCIEKGLPELSGEFSLSVQRVWKSKMGSIAASYITVQSRYDHAPAPVPAPSADNGIHTHHHHQHSHSHEHEHTHEHKHEHHDALQRGQATQDESSHSHGHSHTNTRDDNQSRSLEHNTDGSSHSHSHDHTDTNTSSSSNSSSTHAHSHGHSSAKGPLRNLPQIRNMLIAASSDFIPSWVRDHAIEAFTELARAEAMTHGAASPDAVHFHEVGAIDSIVDTVGSLLALHCLGVTTVSCSRLPLGEGTVWTDHGLLPVPAPATLRLLVDMPTCPGPPGITGELVTPTAAALIKVLTRKGQQEQHGKHPGRPPPFTLRRVGIGAGTKDFVKHPNILRLMIGDNVASIG